MLNFYTAKQGELLEKRVAAVEEGGGGGSGIDTLEIDCTGFVTEGKDYFDPSDSSSAQTMMDLTDAEKAFKLGTIIVLKNLKLGVGSPVPEEQQFTQTIHIYSKSIEDIPEIGRLLNFGTIITTAPGKILPGLVAVLQGHIAISLEEESAIFMLSGSGA